MAHKLRSASRLAGRCVHEQIFVVVVDRRAESVCGSCSIKTYCIHTYSTATRKDGLPEADPRPAAADASRQTASMRRRGTHRRGDLRRQHGYPQRPRTAFSPASASNTFGTRIRSAEAGRWTTLARARSPGSKKERRTEGAETAGERVGRGEKAFWAGGAREESVEHVRIDLRLEAEVGGLDDHFRRCCTWLVVSSAPSCCK